jgi:hypothetical protein
MEAVTKTAQRYEIFADLQQKRVTPVRTRLRTVPERIVDSALILKRLAQSRRKTLISQRGGTGKALDWLYWERRGKAAHADKSSLDFEGLTSLGDQVQDAFLFQFMARVAIEDTWS